MAVKLVLNIHRSQVLYTSDCLITVTLSTKIRLTKDKMLTQAWVIMVGSKMAIQNINEGKICIHLLCCHFLTLVIMRKIQIFVYTQVCQVCSDLTCNTGFVSYFCFQTKDMGHKDTNQTNPPSHRKNLMPWWDAQRPGIYRSLSGIINPTRFAGLKYLRKVVVLIQLTTY